MYPHKNGITWRKVERSDLHDLKRLKSESWWGVHTTPILNDADQDRWFDSLSSKELCMIAEKDCCVGFMLINHIDWISRIASIGAGVYEEHRGGEVSVDVFQAGVDFAFEMLNLHRLDAEVLSTNLAVQKIDLQYLGFTVEGVRRQAVHKCGVYYDSLVLGLLREEWESQERIKAYGGSCNQIWDHETSRKLEERAKKWRRRHENPHHDAVLQPPQDVASGFVQHS